MVKSYRAVRSRSPSVKFDTNMLLSALSGVTNYMTGWASGNLSGVSKNKSELYKQIGYVLDYLHAAVDAGVFEDKVLDIEDKIETLYDDYIRKGDMPADIVNDRALERVIDLAEDVVRTLDGVQEFTYDKIDDVRDLITNRGGKVFKMDKIDKYAGVDFLNEKIQRSGIDFDYEFEPDDFIRIRAMDEAAIMLAENIPFALLSEWHRELLELKVNAESRVEYAALDGVDIVIQSAINDLRSP